MRLTYSLAAAAAWAALALAGPALASEPGSRPFFRPHRALPPVSGTLHVPPGSFGHTARPADAADGGYRQRWDGYAHSRHLRASFAAAQERRFSYPARRYREDYPSRYVRHYGPAYGYQGNAYGQLQEQGTYSYAHVQARHQVDWRGDGTGLVGLIGGSDEGSEGNWRTAEPPETFAYPARVRRYRAEAPVQVTYGEPGLWDSGPGYAPTGGLAYYNSGSPGRMAYYGSSSSAGPRGTPGGLGIYSSGSFGPGPHIIRIGRRYASRVDRREGCVCGGPRIISLRHRTHDYARW